MKAKKKKSLKSGKLTMKQLMQYRKTSKGAKKSYWSGRIKGLEKQSPLGNHQYFTEHWFVEKRWQS